MINFAVKLKRRIYDVIELIHFDIRKYSWDSKISVFWYTITV